MELQSFYIKGRTYTSNDNRLQDALAEVYETPERPRCMCVRGGVPMYIAKFRQYIVKRMPDSGSKHRPACPSYEPEYGQSGLGELVGEAIIEHSPESVELRVDFPLSRIPGKAIARGDAVASAEVNAPRRRMSLRALMHFLFERARFNRWYPAMKDKRSWGVLRKYLLEAAEEIQTKGIRLTERLYIPEAFSEEHKQEIAERRRARLGFLISPEDEVQFKMALVLGEFKGVESSLYARKVWIKHMSDCPLFIDNKAWQRLERVFAQLFEARDADTKAKLRLVMCALIYAKREHTYQIDTASMMLVTDNWIPIEGVHEVDLIQALTEASRSFLKPLRYDAKTAAYFPNAILLDTGDKPTALHVVSWFLDAKERAAKEKAIRRATGETWVWHTDKAMPSLPRAARYRRVAERDMGETGGERATQHTAQA